MNKDNYRKTPYNQPLIEQRADPYVYRHVDGTYYFTASVPEYDRIILRSAGSGMRTAATGSRIPLPVAFVVWGVAQ